ncbi:MAG: hypothetical protein DI539_07205 [Flavobacterium psychrophilum]|nr:MAG: hypothetical protein DI539_07205 [Flavobacterium psychrophilum]
MAHSRIEPLLIDLSPVSVVKVFSALKIFTNFSIKQSKVALKLNEIISGDKYDAHEKYIFLYYLKQYFNKANSRSIFCIKLKEIEDFEDFEQIIAKRGQLEKYQIEIMKICDKHLSEYKRKATSNLKSEIKVNFSEAGLNSKLTSFAKLPYDQQSVEKEKFRIAVTSIFKNIFQDRVTQQLIENFFQSRFIDHNAQMLHIHFTKSDEIFKAFYQLYSLYKRDLRYMKEKAKENLRQIKIKIEDERTSKDEIKPEFVKLLEEKEQLHINFRTNIRDYRIATKKTNFAMMMFLAFPQIRENYAKLNAKKPLTVDEYIEIVSRNIRKA